MTANVHPTGNTDQNSDKTEFFRIKSFICKIIIRVSVAGYNGISNPCTALYYVS